MPKARSDNIGHLKSVFQEPEKDDTVVKEKKKINRNPPFRREGNLGWEPVSVLLDLLTKACLTQNTRLILLAIRVNRIYNQTNSGLIRVTLGPFECIRELCMIFKTFKTFKNRISDRRTP